MPLSTGSFVSVRNTSLHDLAMAAVARIAKLDVQSQTSRRSSSTAGAGCSVSPSSTAGTDIFQTKSTHWRLGPSTFCKS